MIPYTLFPPYNEIWSFQSLDGWSHVASHDNTADVASRGCNAEQLKDDKLWWNGHIWLKENQTKWSTTHLPYETEAEDKICQSFSTTVNPNTSMNFTHPTQDILFEDETGMAAVWISSSDRLAATEHGADLDILIFEPDP